MLVDGSVWLSIGSILTSSFIAIAVVVLGARFAREQAHDGRIWDRKAEAYSAILEALHEMEEWFNRALDDMYRCRDVDEATQATRNQGYRDATILLRRNLARQVWLLPVTVQARVAAMNKVLSARYESWFEDIDAGSFEVRRTIADIVEFARRDMESRKKIAFKQSPLKI